MLQVVTRFCREIAYFHQQQRGQLEEVGLLQLQSDLGTHFGQDCHHY